MATDVLQPPKLSLTRLLLLGASSVVLALSWLMAVFTPFPVAMAVVLYGRAKGYGVALLGFFVSVLICRFFYGSYAAAVFYPCLMVVAVGVAETLLRGWNPVRAILGLGFTVLLAGAGFLAYSSWQLRQSPLAMVVELVDQAKVELQKHNPQEYEQILASLSANRPSVEYARDILAHAPGSVFMTTFFVLWVNMFLGLKGHRLLRTESVAWDESCLLRFRMPFAWAYGVALALALVVSADYLKWPLAEPVGMNLLQMLGVFYFFQGFGVLLSYLNFFNVLGFFRTVIVMGIVFIMPQLLAILGLFDTWFDFTQKLIKKKIP